MRKITNIFLLLFIILFPTKSLYWAYWVDFDWKGFYSSIVDSVWSLEDSLYQLDVLELNTKERINKMLWNDCITEDLTPDVIKDIILNWKIWIIYDYIDKQCMSWETLSSDLLIKIQNAIEKIHDDAQYYSARTAKQIMNIDGTWIYSDWIKENAPFDLILDLQKIDEIVFSKWTENFKEKKEEKIDERINNSLTNLTSSSAGSKTSSKSNYRIEPVNNTYYNDLKLYNDLEMYNPENYTESTNQYACSDNSSLDSWLNKDEINNILWNWNNTWNSASSWWGYKKVDDNRVFPCTDFFCINIEFVTHQSWMDLSWGSSSWGASSAWWSSKSKTMSIEDIIARSNEHLKQINGTSVIPSDLTTNNYEFWLKNINLPEMFSQNFQIYWKPAPILNLTYKEEKQEKDEKSWEESWNSESEWDSEEKVWKDKGQFSVDELLRKYYKTYNLDFSRRNDLSLFDRIEVERQIMINTSRMSPGFVTEKFSELQEYDKKKAEERASLSKLIEDETRISVTWDFELQFKELEIFNKSIKDYVFDLDILIKKMLEKPQDKWTN